MSSVDNDNSHLFGCGALWILPPASGKVGAPFVFPKSKTDTPRWLFLFQVSGLESEIRTQDFCLQMEHANYMEGEANISSYCLLTALALQDWNPNS